MSPREEYIRSLKPQFYKPFSDMKQLASNVGRSPSTQWRRSIVYSRSCVSKRIGMQWRELQPKTASHTSVFKHTRRWIQAGIVQDAYTSVLQQYTHTHPPSHYIVNSTYVKNAFGRDGIGRNPVDRGRKAIKISALTDQDGIVYNIPQTHQTFVSSPPCYHPC